MSNQKTPAAAVGTPDDPRFVYQCLSNGERGDGVLFAAMYKGRFCFVENWQRWLVWQGHYWADDVHNLAMNAVEMVATKYLELTGSVGEDIAAVQEKLAELAEQYASAADEEKAEITQKQKANRDRLEYLKSQYKGIISSVKRLRGQRGAKACLEWAHMLDLEHSLSIKAEALDRHPMKLPCVNGVVDLETGGFHDGNPDDYLMRHVPTEFKGIDEPRPAWEKFIREIHLEDNEMLEFVQTILGYGIAGLRKNHFLAVFTGDGRNGKGTMFETLRTILGPLSWSIESEMLLEQRFAKPSGGASADIAALQGRRMVFSSEIDENRKVSLKAIKKLTGGDTLTARAPHDKHEVNFVPTHTIFWIMNSLARGLAADFAMLSRLYVVDYPLCFVDDPAAWSQKEPQKAELYRKIDRDLPEKLAAEASGILAWLVEGCLRYMRDGIKVPEKVRDRAEEVRFNEDYLARFMKDHDDVFEFHPEARMPFKDFYEMFAEWYEETISSSDRYRPTKQTIGKELDKGYPIERKKVGGDVKILGLRRTGFGHDA